MKHQNWQRIRDSIAADIVEGRLQPGARLPTEAELCLSFGSGRHSLRRAVAALAVEGKLRVEQGRGTFVQSGPLIDYQIGHRTRFRKNLLDQGLSPAGEAISDETMPAEDRIAAALGLAPGAPVHRLLRRGLADGLPVSLGLSYYCAQAFPDLRDRRRAGESVTEIYLSHGIRDYFRKRTTLFARRPHPWEARLLRQHPDQPVMVMQKTDMDPAGRRIGHSEAVWAADRVKFSFDGPDLFDGSDGPDGDLPFAERTTDV